MTADTPLSKEVDQYSLVLQRSFLQQLFDILNPFGRPMTAANGQEQPSRCIATSDGLWLVAVAKLNKANDCCYPEQSLHQGFREGQLYTSKLPLESDDHQVTALACTDLVISTLSGITLRLVVLHPIGECIQIFNKNRT